MELRSVCFKELVVCQLSIFRAQKIDGFKHLRALRQYCTYMIFLLLILARLNNILMIGLEEAIYGLSGIAYNKCWSTEIQRGVCLKHQSYPGNPHRSPSGIYYNG